MQIYTDFDNLTLRNVCDHTYLMNSKVQCELSYADIFKSKVSVFSHYQLWKSMSINKHTRHFQKQLVVYRVVAMCDILMCGLHLKILIDSSGRHW